MATRSKLQRAHTRTVGFRAVYRNLRKFGQQIGAELLKTDKKTAEKVLETARANLRRNPTPPSKPGQPPAMASGELAGSVKLVRDKKAFRVGTAAKQGFFTEFGTVHMRARPWLYPALRQHKQAHERELKTLHARAMKGIDPKEKD